MSAPYGLTPATAALLLADTMAVWRLVAPPLPPKPSGCGGGRSGHAAETQLNHTVCPRVTGAHGQMAGCVGVCYWCVLVCHVSVVGHWLGVALMLQEPRPSLRHFLNFQPPHTSARTERLVFTL